MDSGLSNVRREAAAVALRRSPWPIRSVRATRVQRRAVAARLGLFLSLSGGAVLAFGAAADASLVDTANAPEPSWAQGVLHGLAPAGLSDTAFSLALAAMLIGYIVAVRFADLLPTRLVLAAVAALVLLFTLTPPLMSSDVFGYIAYARLGVTHGLNPYLHGPVAAPHDSVLQYVYWKEPSSPYGPLFTLLTYGVGSASLPVALWSLKALAGLSCLAAVACVGRAASLRGISPTRASLVVGANPVLLVFAVGGAHNDLLAMALVAGALLLLTGPRARAGGATLVAAAAVKISGGLLLPFALLAGRPRRDLLRGAAWAAAATIAVTLAVFGTHALDTVFALLTDSQFNADYSGPDLLGRLLGTGVTPTVHVIAGTSVAVVLLLAIWTIRRGTDWLTVGGWVSLAAICAVPSFVPWYIAWLLPLAALGRSRRLCGAAILLTAVVLITHLPLLGFPAYQ